MSERTLARLVRQEVGMSFGRWRQRLHIILALQWLSEGLSVQRSADQLGYESVSAFITMFRKALGTTPARYFAPATMNRRGNGSSTVPSDRPDRRVRCAPGIRPGRPVALPGPADR